MTWFNTAIYNWTSDLAQGIGVRADRHTAQDQAFINGINAAWCCDPTFGGNNFTPNAATHNMDIGGFKIINAANGTLAQDYATVAQLTGAADSPVWGGTSGGTANAQTITLTPPLGAYSAGVYCDFIVGNTNTGNTTLNISGLGAKSVFKNGNQQLEPGDWKAGTVVSVLYDGTNFQNIAPLFGSLSQSGTQIYAIAAGTANAITVTLSPAPSYVSYPSGFTVRFKAAATNTGAATLAVNGGTASAILNQGNPLNYGDIRINNIYTAIYVTGLGWNLISPCGVPLIRNGATDYATDTGIANALAVTLTPALTNAELLTGTTIFVKALNANTGATTISLSGGGAINIVKLGNVALVANDILAGQILELCYDGTNFQLLSPLGNNVTQVSTGTGLSGGPITSTGTLTVASGVPIQVVNAAFTGTTTIPAGAFADTGLTVTITPSATTSRILITYSVSASVDVNSEMFFNLVRGASNILQGAAAGSRTQCSNAFNGTGAANFMYTVSNTFVDSPSTTNPTTYKLQAKCDIGNSYINFATTDTNSASFPRAASTITVMEIK